MSKLSKIFGTFAFVAIVILTSTGVASAANLVIEPQARTVFTSQALPVLIYTEPIITSGDTTDIDITLVVTEAELTSIKKITLAPKVSRRESSSVQLVPATGSESAKRIITEKLTYAGKIKANKLVMTVFLKAIYAGEFSVSGEGAVGNYTIQGTTRTQPPLGDGDADVTPAQVGSVATAAPMPTAYGSAVPDATDVDGGTTINSVDSAEEDTTCTPVGGPEKPNYILWIILWTLSLLVALFTGYFISKKKV